MTSDENHRNIKIDDMGNLVTKPIEEVFEKLDSRRYGLTHEEFTERRKIFGPNIIEEKKESIIPKLLGFMWNPLSWGLEIGALLAIVLIPGKGQPPDWPIFVGIVLLLIINAIVCCIEENRAANAAAALLVGLAATVRIRRSGKWKKEEVSLLVPGDVMEIKLGDIIPADARLLDGEPVIIDQSSLTGESLPVTKYPGDVVFSGSTCKQGETEAVVIATGVHTFFAKTANLVDITDQVGHFQKVLTAVGNFCICFIAIGIVLGLLVMLPIQHRNYRKVIDNLLVVLIGGIPIAMPTVLSSTMAVGSHRLSQQGAVIKRMGVVEDLARMDILCCNQTGSLIGNNLKADEKSIKVFVNGTNSDTVILLGARASRLEDQDIVGLLANSNDARAGITEMHFMPFNPEDKCTTTITYVDSDGIWHRVSKGAPEQIILLCNLIGDELKNAQTSVHQLNEKGFRTLGVARQYQRSKESPGGPWEFVGLLPLYHSPSTECLESIIVALKLGVNVKMISSDQLAFAKDICRRLDMGTDIYLSSSLLGERQGEIAGLPVDELIEQADGFALVSPDHKYEIVTKLQLMKHICGMTGDGVNDARALRKADIGFALVDATNAARCASDIILTQPGLTVIINAVLTSRAIFQRMKNYTIYAVSATVYFVLALMLIALIWKFDFSPLMVLIISILNNTTIMTISKDRVKPSPHPDSWKFREIFATGIVRGTYMAAMTLIFFEIAHDTDFFSETFGVRSISNNYHELTAALYLQVSIMSQALILATRSRKSSFTERPGLLLVAAFLVAQLVATLIAVYASIGFARTKGIGWGWAGVIWLYSAGCYFFLDIGKLAIHQSRGKVWNNLLRNKINFTSKNNFGKGDRESKWVMDKRTSLGLQPVEPAVTFHAESTFPKLELLKRPRDKLNLLAWKKCLHTQVMRRCEA